MNLNPNVNCQHLEVEKNHYFFNPTLVNNFQPTFFSSHFWQEQNAIEGSAQGRGTTWFLKHDKQHWVLKHYYRGGLIGRLLSDSYVYTGLQSTRSVAEFTLLSQLNELDLPAPKPVACSVFRQGLSYKADLITTRIEKARDLVDVLSNEPLEHSMYQNIGATIKRFHQHGIYHHDLNIHNILIDNHENVWLIDFDRAKILKPKIQWQQANLNRLKRSFLKEKNRLVDFHWQEQAFSHLLLGYNTAR